LQSEYSRNLDAADRAEILKAEIDNQSIQINYQNIKKLSINYY